MEKEHFADRVARTARPFILGFVVITGPVFLFTYVWAMKLLAGVVPLWAFAAICACHIMAWFAVGSLFDIQQERRNRR
jgi:hypothetical protein